MRALLLLLLLLLLLRSNRSLLEEEECLDGIPLGLGHGLQAHGRIRPGRNRHLGVILSSRRRGGAILLLRPKFSLKSGGILRLVK